MRGPRQAGSTADIEIEAEGCFQNAIEVARRQKAKSWELHAALSLARFWKGQGRIQEAKDLLEEVYGCFTEGFETKDLREARALLDELMNSA